MDFLHGPSGQTANTDLAAAMCTLGIPLDEDRPCGILVGDIERVTFFFGGKSSCGHYSTAESMAHWDDPRLDIDRPRHAMTYMRTALRGRQRLIDYAQSRYRVGIAARTAGKFEVVRLPDDAAPARPRTRPSTPEESTTPRLQTDDLELAAALLACGLPLWRDFPMERREGSRLSFFFMPASPCGAFHTRELMLAWQQADWHEQNPEHPLAYVRCVFENRRRLVRLLRGTTPTACFHRGGFPQFLTVNADPAVEKSFMTELNKL